MTVRARHAVVLGAGESGSGAALLLRREGARVTVFDRAAPEPKRADFREIGAELVAAREETPIPMDADLCVVSPGIPIQHPWLVQARAQGLPIIPEFELGWSRFHGKTLAITGTNGKSTMVKWAAESLIAAGLRAAPCGNYGPSVCRTVVERPDLEWLVIEASSFQLEAAVAFRAEIGMLLNLAPNHLDRHGTMGAYVSAKAKVFARVQCGDVCLVPTEWISRIRAESNGAGRWVSFGARDDAEIQWRDGRVLHGAKELVCLDGTYFDNPVLGPHAAALAGAFEMGGLPCSALERAARAFQPLPHRMEPVAEIRGVLFIDDSKATTLSAMAAALQMARRPVRLICGGLLKQSDLESVKEVLASRARAVYLIGSSANLMRNAWSDVADCRSCGTLEVAVRTAWQEAREGEAILLSPGCASFDQFSNYMERGTTFRRIAQSIAGELIT